MDEAQRTEAPGDRVTGGRGDACVVTSLSDPFDAGVSGREPFPSFEAALAAQEHEQKEEDGGGALNWSIDTLAEIQPLAFSPLPQQNAAADGVTPAFTPRAAAAQAFFDDEKQYSVLRTPLPRARPPRDVPVAMRRATPPTPLELHRRCRETIARCEARMRERQGKMERLQVVLHATPKRSPHHRQQQQQRRGSPQQRSTPPRPVKRSKRGIAAIPNSEMAPNTRQPRWSASPIRPMQGTRQSFDATPSALEEFPLTPSVPEDTDRPMETQRLEPRISFGLSPITSSSPDRRPEGNEEEEKDTEEKESMAWSASGETPPSSTMKHGAVTTPSPAFSADGEKENDSLQQLQRQHEQSRDAGSSWSHTVSNSSFSIASTTRSTKKPVTTASRSSIPRRQQAFMAAIEAEAASSQPRVSSRGDPTGTRPTAATSSSILALYQEAKRMGVSDPQAQWEYVQLLLPGRQKHKQKR